MQIHVVEELLEMLQCDESEPKSNESVEDTQGQELLSLSKQAAHGTEGDATMRLHGKVQGYHALILIDYGSSSSFIR